MKRFLFAFTLALALVAGSQGTARANGGTNYNGSIGLNLGFKIGFSYTSNCQQGYCPSSYCPSGYCPSPYDNFAPSHPYGAGSGSGYGSGYGYYAPQSYYGGYGY